VKVKSSLAATASALLLAALPLAVASATAAKTTHSKTTAASVGRSAWRPETMSGKIAKVDPGQKLLVIETPDRVPFDMLVTARTRIQSGGQTIALKDLTRDTNKMVSVKFIPERRGDVAKSIQLNG